MNQKLGFDNNLSALENLTLIPIILLLIINFIVLSDIVFVPFGIELFFGGLSIGMTSAVFILSWLQATDDIMEVMFNHIRLLLVSGLLIVFTLISWLFIGFFVRGSVVPFLPTSIIAMLCYLFVHEFLRVTGQETQEKFS